MPLQPFNFDKKPDIRLVVYQNIVYKIKVTCRQSSDRESIRRLFLEDKNNKDLERVVCAILNTYDLIPVQTDNFVVYPYKNYWETRERLVFSQHGHFLEAHKYSFTFYVEEKQKNHGQIVQTDRAQEQEEHVNQTSIPSGSKERIVTEYGQKNRHDVEEKELKEFLRLQNLASKDDKQTEDSEQPTSGLQKVFNALVSPVRSLLGN
nr:membrane-anchored junction protein-like isoform X1 [Pocillopora verrucosa]